MHGNLRIVSRQNIISIKNVECINTQGKKFFDGKSLLLPDINDLNES